MKKKLKIKTAGRLEWKECAKGTKIELHLNNNEWFLVRIYDDGTIDDDVFIHEAIAKFLLETGMPYTE